MADSTTDATRSTMLYGGAPERRARALEEVRRRGFISVADLADALGVSPMTSRRDLQRLASDGTVRLVHGGAAPVAGPDFAAPYATRQEAHPGEKSRIGAAVAALLPANGAVGFDAGTTALEAARHLPADFAGTVVTNSVPVLDLMLERPRSTVICIGGELLHESRCLVGPDAASLTRGLKVRTLVLGAGAVDHDGVYVRSRLELDAKRALLDIADEVVLAADVSKFDVGAPVRVCGLERVDTWVVDGELPRKVAEVARRNGTRVIVI